MAGGPMTKIRERFLLFVFFAFSMASTGLLRPGSALAQEQTIQVVELAAKKFEYSPSPLRVKAGSKVQLKITAIDHDHGFKIAAVADGSESQNKPGLLFSLPQDCWQLKKGETTTIEFVAQTPGTYAFKCCHTCGLGHRGMKSQLVVY
jgi:heme/copper-type cytochrome/quinol oxidase subunit 2